MPDPVPSDPFPPTPEVSLKTLAPVVKAPRKATVRLSPAQWAAARYDFESGKLRFKHEVAASYGISNETVEKRSRIDGWMRNSEIGASVSTVLRQATDKALEATAAQIAAKLGRQFEDDLRPWLEREKRQHIQDSIKRSKLRQKMVDSIVASADSLTPKDLSYIAKTDDTYDAIKRRNLGLNDDKAPAGGALSINILTNQAAVSVA